MSAQRKVHKCREEGDWRPIRLLCHLSLIFGVKTVTTDWRLVTCARCLRARPRRKRRKAG